MTLRISGNYPWGSVGVIDADLRVLSLGAGVQSTTLFYMILDGYFDPAPSCAIFSDTGWEPPSVYEHLEDLKERAAQYDFPIHVVRGPGNLKQDALTGDRMPLPLYTVDQSGSPIMIRRECTRHYKIDPIRKKVRELLGYKKGEHYKHTIEMWQGISRDEMTRMREHPHKKYWNRYPLVERRMTRIECAAWLRDNGYTLPTKSACVACPYHDDAYWKHLKTHAPALWQDAVDFDNDVRNALDADTFPMGVFVHRQMIPLEEVVFLHEDQYDLFSDDFSDECEGMCGV